MKKKRLKCTAICLLLAMLLSACGAEQVPEETPAPAETEEPQEEVFTDEYAGTLRISEIMPKNGAAYFSSGGFFDWFEIENISAVPVPLDGWSFIRNGDAYKIHNGTVLQPGNFCVVLASGGIPLEEPYVDCKIAPGDMIAISSPGKSETAAVECFEERHNISVALNAEGMFESCEYPTPGCANTGEEYDRLCSLQSCGSPLVINEISGKNGKTVKCNTGYEDWIELCNVSGSDVHLSDYYLSDDEAEPLKFRLPDTVLGPGEKQLVWCSGTVKETDSRNLHANFSISGEGESIFLSTETGYADFAAFPAIPTDWSFGRRDGENGWFIFQKPTPGDSNGKGFRRISAQPQALTQPGCYDGMDAIMVELAGNGTVYYTLDGTVPTADSEIYSGPIKIKKTTVIRCINVEEGLAQSRDRTLSYFINEGHKLPVLSLVADDYSAFKSLYYNASLDNRPQKELPVSLSLYDSGEVFSQRGAVSMKGWTSLDLPKKSVGVKFTGKYGDGPITCDIFSDGVNKYSSFSIRAGQDYTFSVIKNELVQELSMEATDNVPTQHGKYCALYINGYYWGLFCLKEDVSRSYYANLKGVDKDQVIKNKSPVAAKTPAYKEFYKFCKNNDLSKPENYEKFCSVFDIDNLIDWIIIEGFSANPDINGNMRYFRTQEGKWQIVLYDLDWSLRGSYSGTHPFENILGNSKVLINSDILSSLIKNEDFKNALYNRAVELFSTTLSNEHVLEKIDELAATVEPEIARDRQRWDLRAESWYLRVDDLRNFIKNYKWDESCLNALKKYLKIQ